MNLPRRALPLSGAACVLALALASALPPLARPAVAQATLGSALGGSAGWQQLTPSEQKILMPLRDQWVDIEPLRRQKWRDIAAIYPKLPAEQQGSKKRQAGKCKPGLPHRQMCRKRLHGIPHNAAAVTKNCGGVFFPSRKD